MAVWLLLVVAAQFINAIVALIDKYIVSSPSLPRPLAYAFYLSILSTLSIFVFAFENVPIPLEGVSIPSFSNVSTPSFEILSLSLLAGAALLGALVAMFTALRRADASDVVPVIGASSAITALILSFVLLNGVLTAGSALGFALLVIGTLVLSFFRFGTRVLVLCLIAGILFGAHFVGLKILFEISNFDNAFFWSRMGIVAVALLLLLVPAMRRALAPRENESKSKAGAFIIGNKLLAGLASLMLLKAIELGDVSIVQALGGLQFAFLLGLATITSRGLPKVCGERCSPYQLVHKTVAVSIIVAGFIALFL